MANEGEKLIFLLSIREPGPEKTPEGGSYAEVGTLATVRVIEREEDVVRVVLDGLRRADSRKSGYEGLPCGNRRRTAF